MSEILNQIPGPLLQWYDSRARVLPWRSQPTPYRVWVSEIMLQQTRVEAALPYFDRFMAALPDIAALAQAPEAQLLKLWEGLGYYSRVRNLQKAARQVMEQWGGMLPQKLEDLIALPGIGEYSAGAIASIAYGQRVPAVDGNVLRVVSRLLASRENVMDPKVKRQLRQQVADRHVAARPVAETHFEVVIGRDAVYAAVEGNEYLGGQPCGDRDRETEYKGIPVTFVGVAGQAEKTDAADERGENRHAHDPCRQRSFGGGECSRAFAAAEVEAAAEEGDAADEDEKYEVIE